MLPFVAKSDDKRATDHIFEQVFPNLHTIWNLKDNQSTVTTLANKYEHTLLCWPIAAYFFRKHI